MILVAKSSVRVVALEKPVPLEMNVKMFKSFSKALPGKQFAKLGKNQANAELYYPSYFDGTLLLRNVNTFIACIVQKVLSPTPPHLITLVPAKQE